MTYIVTFAFSCLSAGRVQKSKNKYHRFFWGLICVLLPAIFLGGLRASSVGTDNYLYYSTMFARYHNTTNIFDPPSTSSVSNSYYEPLFSALMFIVSRFTKDYHWFCFITVFIEMAVVLKALTYFEKNVSLSFTLLAYYLMFFCPFINLVRQSLAVAVCLYSLRYIFEKKPVKFAICVGIAACFHITALVFALAYFVTFYQNTKQQNRRVLIFVCLVIALYLLFPFIGRMMLNLGILSAHYATYIPSSVAIKWSHLLYRLPLIIVMGIFLKKMGAKDKIWYSVFLFLIVDVVLSQFAATRSSGVRLAYYFGVLAVPCYSGICRMFKDYRSKVIAYIIALVYLFAYWTYWVVYNNFAYNMPVFPYVSDVVKWLF